MSEFRYTRPDTFPPIVKNLIIINVLVFIACALFDSQYHLTDLFALHPILPAAFKDVLAGQELPKSFNPYEIVTHMFTHGGIAHIAFNMFALFVFGRVLENVWGSKRFLGFYLACGLGAGAFHLLIQYLRLRYGPIIPAIQANDLAAFQKSSGALIPVIGASGAIMGVLAGFALLFPNTELNLMFIPIPIKAKWMVLLYAAYDLFGGAFEVGDNIAHFAHLGGALTGFIIVMIWNKTNRRTLY